ncbi:MAG: hypothetical protein IPK71_23250 [Myxococcales bacterium]|nr:hypothetical protein [Myxococcales bacterium]
MRLSWVLPAFAVSVVVACSTFGSDDDDPSPVADGGAADADAADAAQSLPDGAPPPLPDASPDADAGTPCRPPLARLGASTTVPVSSSSVAALPDGDLVVAGQEACAGGTFGVYRVTVGKATTRAACLGEPAEFVVGIAADATGVAVLTRHPGAGFPGSRLYRLKLDLTERAPPVSTTTPAKTTFPTAVARVNGLDLYATFDSTDSVLRLGSDARTMPFAGQVIASLVPDGQGVLAVVTPSNTTGATEVWLHRWNVAQNLTLIDDSNFGPQGRVRVPVAAASSSYVLYTSTSIASRDGVTSLGIPVSGSATAYVHPAKHTVGPVGSGVGLVSVAHVCDGSLLVAHGGSGQGGAVSRFAKPATEPTADATWQLMTEGRLRGLVTLPAGDFAVTAEANGDAGLETRITKLAR